MRYDGSSPLLASAGRRGAIADQSAVARMIDAPVAEARSSTSCESDDQRKLTSS